ncbi:MAG: hypothetical protein ACI9MC_000217 [Kiritimatiellia bacterium]
MRHGVGLPRLLALWMLSGCSAPTLRAVDPEQGSALGGDEVMIFGEHLPEDGSLWFGELTATYEWRDTETLIAVSPRRTSGVVDVSLKEGDDVTWVADAWTWLALDLRFSQAAPHYLPATELDVRRARVGDLDGDGFDDVILVGFDGSTALWWGDGASLLDNPAGPKMLGHVRDALPLDADGDGVDDLIVCHGTIEGMTLYAGGSNRALPTVPVAMPLDDGSCVDLAVADLDGDERPDLWSLERRSGGDRLHGWRNISDKGSPRFERWSHPEVSSRPASACAVEGAATCVITASGDGYRAMVAFDGAGDASLRLAMPALDRGIDGLSLELRSDDIAFVQIYAIDQDGDRFEHDVDVKGKVSQGGLEAWSHSGGDGELSLPLREVGVVLRAEGPASIAIDDVQLLLEGGGRASVARFEHPVPAAGLSVAARAVRVADFDGDGDQDVLLSTAQTSDGVMLLERAPDRLIPTAAGRLLVPCNVGGLDVGDTDGDGAIDIVAACRDGQDRLLRNDGAGWFFDDTVAAMPVDVGDGLDTRLVDLDLDGLPEVLIATWGGVDRLYGSHGGVYLDRSPELSLLAGKTRALVPIDVDGDGDLDVVRLWYGGSAELWLSGG